MDNRVKIQALLIDDDDDFAFSFVNKAKSKDIFIRHFKNFTEMKEILPKVANIIDCIILDVMGLDDSDAKVANPEFINKALELLDNNYKNIPRYIITGDKLGYDGVKNYRSKEPLYFKDNDSIEDLFDALKKETDRIRVVKPNEEVFSILNKFSFSEEIEAQLIDLLIKQNKSDFNISSDNLAKIRRILEGILLHAANNLKGFPAVQAVRENSTFDFWAVHNALDGNRTKEKPHKPTAKVFYTGSVCELVKMTFAVCSTYGSHNIINFPESGLSSYTIKTCTNAILEVILWLGYQLKKS
ncbi:hypothetical protein [Clostridium sp.]|uniref:hypothetical protein n=1 Tax=Clostridium sp. TaxID=1506 RepID=UPI0028427E88|nr:hypothetical protein [Clostridium sp.]MDR3596511.1 hypothetical protein [Clostridium sp.]